MFPSAIFLWALCSTLRLANAAQSNTTIDDSDPSISYQPANRWRSSSDTCSSCLNTDSVIAYNKTFHEVVPGNLSINSNQRRGGSLAVRAVDPPVSAQLSFTGTAVYVYCIIPTGPSTTNPTDTNLTFTLDGHDMPVGFVQGPAPTSSHALAFSQVDLTNTAHTLQMNVVPDSAFLLDYIVFTKSDTPTPTGVSSSASPTTTDSAWTTWHNMATFMGAIGGGFGGLFVIVVGIIVSIMYRKRRARIRDAQNQQNLDKEAQTKEAEANSAEAQSKFTPRYFPGTVPPAYSPPASTSSSDLSRSSSRRSSFNVIRYGMNEHEHHHHSNDVLPYMDGQSTVRPSESIDIAMPLRVFSGAES